MTQISATTGQASQRRPGPWGYLWWTATGVLVGFGVVSLLTIGVFLLPAGMVLAVVGSVWGPLRNRSVIALVGGLAAAPLYLAWLNREGPGTVCEALEDEVTSCSDRWSPWPFLAVATALLAVGIFGAVRGVGARRSG